MRTNNLKKLIQTKLKSLNIPVYYKRASDSAGYPHIVFTLRSINTGDLIRSDYDLEIDIWDKGKAYDADETADTVEELLKSKNFPTDEVLPTFYADNRKTIDDEDKAISHIRLSFVVQTYER